MSKEAENKAAEGDASPKKSKKLLLIAIGVALVVAIAITGAVIFLKKSHADHPEGDDDEEVTEVAKNKKKDKKKESIPVFVALDPFTVNLLPEEAGDQYLQVAISLEIEDLHAEPELKARIPKVRNDILAFLAEKKATELRTKEGRMALAENLRDNINRVLDPSAKKQKGATAPEGPVVSVLFTSFIIQ